MLPPHGDGLCMPMAHAERRNIPGTYTITIDHFVVLCSGSNAAECCCTGTVVPWSWCLFCARQKRDNSCHFVRKCNLDLSIESPLQWYVCWHASNLPNLASHAEVAKALTRDYSNPFLLLPFMGQGSVNISFAPTFTACPHFMSLGVGHKTLLMSYGVPWCGTTCTW